MNLSHTAPAQPAKQQGSSTIELALTLPLMLLIFWGAVTYGVLLHARMVIARAAEDAARSVSFLSAAEDIANIEAAILAPCTSPTQISVACEAIASLERSLLIIDVAPEADRLDTIRGIAEIEVASNTCGAQDNALGVRVKLPTTELRFLPSLTLGKRALFSWIPSELVACAVVGI